MADGYLAHIAEDRRAQTVLEHCVETAELAAECLAAISMDRIAFLAGLLHDLGKYETAFQEYLLKASNNEKVRRGSVRHTFQGCRYILTNFHKLDVSDYSDITAEIIAYAIGAHHGLFDCIDEKQRSGFAHRVNTETSEYEQALSRFRAESEEVPEKCFAEANRQMQPIYAKLNELSEDMLFFHLGMLSRT